MSRIDEDAAALWDFYGHFGQLMYQVQLFELSVRGLFSLTEPHEEDATVDAALERLFRRPLGKLSKRLGAADQLASDLESAVAARNHLAHHYLLDAIFRVNSGSSSVEEETSSLKTLFRRFEQLVSDLDDFQDARLSELGIDVSPDLSDAELERILREPHT